MDKGYHRLGMFDCETFEVGEDKTLQDNLVHFSYESCVAGIFHSITFTHRYFTYALSDSIEKNTFVFDYLPSTITNVFNPDTGLLEVKKPPKKPRKSYKGNFKGQKVVVIDEEEEEEGGGGAGLEEEGVEEVVAEQEEEDPNNPYIHWNLEEYIKKTAGDNTEVMADYKAYIETLAKYSKVVHPKMQQRSVSRFLCFLINSRHHGRVVISHFGAKFDSVIGKYSQNFFY